MTDKEFDDLMEFIKYRYPSFDVNLDILKGFVIQSQFNEHQARAIVMFAAGVATSMIADLEIRLEQRRTFRRRQSS